MATELFQGVYEALLSKEMRDLLDRHPDLRAVFGKLDPEEEPARYAAFIAKVLEEALRQETDSGTRLELCNQLITLVAGRERACIGHGPPRRKSRSPAPATGQARSAEGPRG